MTSNEKKILSVRLDPQMHQKIKLYAVQEGISMQDYVLKLVENDFKQHEKTEKLNAR